MFTCIYLIIVAVGILVVWSDNIVDIDVERDAQLSTVNILDFYEWFV